MYRSSRSNQNYKTIASRSYSEHNLRPWHDSAMQPDVGLGAQARSTMPNLRAAERVPSGLWPRQTAHGHARLRGTVE